MLDIKTKRTKNRLIFTLPGTNGTVFHFVYKLPFSTNPIKTYPKTVMDLFKNADSIIREYPGGKKARISEDPGEPKAS